MPSQSYTLRNRTRNAHPGLVDCSAPRRSSEEVARAKKEQEEAKRAKEEAQALAKAAKAQRIAAIEEQIDEEDAVNDTPRPQFNKKAQNLRRTVSYLEVPAHSNRSDEYLDMDVDDNNIHAGTDRDEGSEFPGAGVDVDDGSRTDIEEEMPARKKKVVKKQKVSIRDTIAVVRATAEAAVISDSEDEEPLASGKRGRKDVHDINGRKEKGKYKDAGLGNTSLIVKASEGARLQGNLGVAENIRSERSDHGVKVKKTASKTFVDRSHTLLPT
jgi:hypothetical protein